MAKASNNDFPSILMTEQAVKPSAPAAGKWRIYPKTDHKFYWEDSGGTETEIGGAAGSVATDAIWDAAGDLAVGSGANTAAKLSKGADGAVLAMGNGAVIWNAGVAFPGSKATYDRYWRTDLGLEFYWDGTRWVTTTLYIGTLDSVMAQPVTSDNTTSRLMSWATTFDLWLDAFYSSTYVTTTNDGSKYWTVTLRKVVGNESKTTIVSFNTSADTVNEWTQRRTAIGAAYVAANYRLFDVGVAKTSTPGDMFWTFSMTYRLIAT